jgi:hypothetical protein
MEGLVQIVDCTGGKRPRADFLIRLPGDEHNGDRLTAPRELFCSSIPLMPALRRRE